MRRQKAQAPSLSPGGESLGYLRKSEAGWWAAWRKDIEGKGRWKGSVIELHGSS